MKVTTKTLSDELLQENDFSASLEILIDDEEVFSVSDGDSEDNTLSRNFSDCYSIVELMRRAYEAGKNGEEFVYEDIIITEW